MRLSVLTILLFLANAAFSQMPNLGQLTNALNNTNNAINNLATSANGINTTAGQLNQTAGQINQTAGQINQTAGRALDMYEETVAPQIDRALDLGESVNSTLKSFIDPKAVFLAGLSGAAGSALGGFLVNAAISGMGQVFSLLTTDYDRVALDVFEANVSALHKAQENLLKLERVHQQMARSYRFMQLPIFRQMREQTQEQRMRTLTSYAEEAFCRQEMTRTQVNQLLEFGSHLDQFTNNSRGLYSELCRYKSLIDSTKLSIQRHVAEIQANFGRAKYALRDQMYRSFEEAAEGRRRYLRDSDIRLQRNKVALLNCVRNNAPSGQSVVEQWNRQFCTYRGPELCLDPRTYGRLDLRTQMISGSHNCIWECVPPETEDLQHLGCPVRAPIPIVGILFGRDRDCLRLKESIQSRVNGECSSHRNNFGTLRAEIQTEIDQLPDQVRRQQGQAWTRITNLEHTIQQIMGGIEGEAPNRDQLREEYHQFLQDVCGAEVR